MTLLGICRLGLLQGLNMDAILGFVHGKGWEEVTFLGMQDPKWNTHMSVRHGPPPPFLCRP